MSLGDQVLHDLPVHVSVDSGGLGSHLGMDVLKRFNTVLDFQNDVAYFTPSTLHKTAYRTDYADGGWWIVPAAVSFFLVVVFIWVRRRALRIRELKGVR